MKILIIRFSSIGDIVLTSPVIRCLKKQLNAEIHYFTKRNFESVLKNNPYIDRLHYLSNNFQEDVNKLRLEKFDLIIDLHNNLRTFRFKKSLGIKAYSFNKINLAKWFYVNLKWNMLPKVHIVDRYLETCASLGVINDNHGLDYFISEEDEKVLGDLPILFKGNYIGIAIGAQHATKRLPKNKLIELCNKLNWPIVLLGGKEDVEIAEDLVKINPNKIYNACGKYNLNESAALVKNAQYIISHDTGLMHIAAAFKKKIFSIWGNTVPEFGMYPYKTEFESIQVEQLNCRPCSKIGYSACPKKHFNCMNLQDLEGLSIKLNALK